MNQGTRRAALALHALTARDRRWALAQLSPMQRLRLAPQLAELKRLGWPSAVFDESLFVQAEGHASAAADGPAGHAPIVARKALGDAQCLQLATQLIAEPAWLQADVLACMRPREAGFVAEALRGAGLANASVDARAGRLPPLRQALVEQWLHEQASLSREPPHAMQQRSLLGIVGRHGVGTIAGLARMHAHAWQTCSNACRLAFAKAVRLRDPDPSHAAAALASRLRKEPRP